RRLTQPRRVPRPDRVSGHSEEVLHRDPATGQHALSGGCDQRIADRPPERRIATVQSRYVTDGARGLGGWGRARHGGQSTTDHRRGGDRPRAARHRRVGSASRTARLSPLLPVATVARVRTGRPRSWGSWRGPRCAWSPTTTGWSTPGSTR